MKPGIPKGTRDFTPTQVYRRQYILQIIQSIFEKYGYQPIETPAMEKLETLTGKYGDEGDQLIFKVLNNGDYLRKADPEALSEKDSQKLIPSIARRGLRYDLTVPFARFVTMHQHELQFPFKRYQMQPVWRADRPQKGRYQEFYQCDADAIGTDSLICEAEYIRIIDQVFDQLGIKVSIFLNNRKVLAGIAELLGAPDRLAELTVTIDKLDKIGREAVDIDLLNKGFDNDQISKLHDFLDLEELSELSRALATSIIGSTGVSELSEVLSYLEGMELNNHLRIKTSLARGLNYYTGCIFEVTAHAHEMGSLLGGGRYDDLTGVFGLKGVSGVGISFGVERIYDICEAANLFPDVLDKRIKALFLGLDKESHRAAFALAERCRIAGIACDVYPDPAKLRKQMKFANQIGVRYTIVLGSEELQSRRYTCKDMDSGDQELLDLDQLIQKLAR
ncbi:MAG: histidine--tRNA ligase [Saprospiraceae bacterium]|nr:histidine--tRNA ligase [Saprospiraceae bacterium]